LRQEGDFEVTPAYEFRPIDRLSSKKRPEARRRRDLVTDVGRQIALAIASWTRGENGLHSTAA